MTSGPTTAGKMSAFAALWAALRRQRRPDAPGIWEQMAALPRLIKQTLKGTYPGMDRSRLLMMVGALLYIVSPIDLVPESMFLFLGLTDDAFVLTWLAGMILAETEGFLAWEGTTQDGPAAHGTARPRVVQSEVL